MRISVSAPGKLMLMGEHAVVYGYSCLVMAINKRVRVEIEKSSDRNFILDAPDIGVKLYSKPIKNLGKGNVLEKAEFIERTVSLFFQKFKITSGVKISTRSDFSPLYGLGSSASIVVATVKALCELFAKKFTQKELFDFANKSVTLVQQVGSGADVAASVFGGLLYYQKRGQTIERISVDELPLMVIYSGIKADTVDLVRQVAGKIRTHKKGIETIFENISKLVEEANLVIPEKNWERLGILINYNQDYLENLGVSTERLNNLIQTCRERGAWGVKLSGAGGGDCIIALVEKEKRKKVSRGTGLIGGEIIDISLEKEGVRIENPVAKC